jgi:GNAT superfamily N-acetyltransferase
VSTAGEVPEHPAVRVRPIGRDDGPRLLAFHDTLPPEAVRMRYLGEHPSLRPGEVLRLVDSDPRDGVALVALRGDDVVGVARWDRVEGTDAVEVALLLPEDVADHVVGTELLDHLVEAARAVGVERAVLYVLAENRPLLVVLAEAGFDDWTDLDGVVVRVEARLGSATGPTTTR